MNRFSGLVHFCANQMIASVFVQPISFKIQPIFSIGPLGRFHHLAGMPQFVLNVACSWLVGSEHSPGRPSALLRYVRDE